MRTIAEITTGQGVLREHFSVEQEDATGEVYLMVSGDDRSLPAEVVALPAAVLARIGAALLQAAPGPIGDARQNVIRLGGGIERRIGA